jgi:hypothetical protein
VTRVEAWRRVAAIVSSPRPAERRRPAALCRTTIDAALSPETDPVKAAHLALGIIREAEPRESSTLEVSAPMDVESLSLAQLIALSEQRGLDLTRPESTPPELPA